MLLHQKIKREMVEAMKARDEVRLNTLRGLLAAFTNEAVANKQRPDTELSDEEALAVIARAVKQRKDSIEQFKKGNRADLVAAEAAELKILESYLPTQMSKEELLEFVSRKKAELNMDKSQMGQFIGIVMKELRGRADGSLVREVVTELFS